MTNATALTAASIRAMMRANGKTISGLAASMNITQKRVRFVRANGVAGACFVQDWLEALQA